MNSMLIEAFVQCQRKRNLTNEEHQAIVEELLRRSNLGKLKQGYIGEIAALFSISNKTIHRIWSQAKACVDNGL